MFHLRAFWVVFGVSLLFIGLADPMGVLAQESQAEDLTLDQIMVTAGRTEADLLTLPMSVTVVDKAKIEEHFPGAATAEKLLEVPGVSFSQGKTGAGNNSMVSIRGERPWRILYLIDGVRQSSPFKEDMNKGLLNVDPADIERIEVIKGPASALYGSDAIGGVINVITKKGGEGKPVGGRVGLTYNSSNEGFQPTAAIYGDTEKFSYRLSGSYQKAGDRRSERVGRMDHTHFQTESFLGQFGYTWDNGNVDFKFSHYDSNVDETTTVWGNRTFTYYPKHNPINYELSSFPKNRRDTFMGRLVLNNLVDHFDQLSVFTYYQDLDVYQRSTIYNDPVNNGRLNMVLQDIVKTFGTTVQTDWSFGDHTVIAGFEYIYDDLTGYTRPGGITNPINVIEGSQTTKAVYLQDSWNVYGPITLVGGLRHTWVDMELSRFTEIPNLEKELSFTNLVGNLGLTVAVNDDLVLRAQYAQGFRTPDMAAKLTGTGDYIVPNYDLEPETSENYEIGARYYDGQLYADLSLFYNIVEDYMATKYLYTINNHWVSEYVNSSQYTAYGLELAAAWRIGETGFTPYGNITSIHTELEENDIKTRNTGTPKTWGTLGLKWETGLGDSGRFFTDASYRISGGSKLGATSWYDVHAGRTMDLTFGLEYGEAQKFKAIVSVRNVFDKDYEPAYFYYPGRHVVVSVSYMF